MTQEPRKNIFELLTVTSTICPAKQSSFNLTFHVILKNTSLILHILQHAAYSSRW